MAKNFNSKSDRSLPHRKGGGRVFFFYFFIFLLPLFSSCHNSSGSDDEEQARRDSAALHVALMPVEDCIPFYYAQRTGIYDSLGLDLRILTLQAQLDTDTALTRGHVELAYSDLARAMMMQQDTVSLRAVASPSGALYFITTRRGRVRQLSQLRERMVAVARHSITDYWSDRLTDTAQLARADIFRPQINDVRIRTDMICNGTMDAAFLPQPYANEVLLRGNKLHFTTEGQTPKLITFIAPEWALADSSRCQQLHLLFSGYEQAVTELNQNMRRDTLARIYRDICLLPDTLIDTLITLQPRFTSLAAPRTSDAETALEWLKTRNKVKTGYTADSLIYEFRLP